MLSNTATVPQTVIDIQMDLEDPSRPRPPLPTKRYLHRMWQAAGWASHYTLHQIDHVGEKLADFFGITAPKYGLYLQEALFEAQEQQAYLVQTSIAANARRDNPYLRASEGPKRPFSISLFSRTPSSSSSNQLAGEL